ncbi:MAG: hypothetical protein A2Y38_22385 [Spirochaetes bacterium GWB1_59_5]|nr:MAG: hypothetical protein A2Y38_22385 [Spirochaetes bacterium GWB1_59_5]
MAETKETVAIEFRAIGLEELKVMMDAMSKSFLKFGELLSESEPLESLRAVTKQMDAVSGVINKATLAQKNFNKALGLELSASISAARRAGGFAGFPLGVPTVGGEARGVIRGGFAAAEFRGQISPSTQRAMEGASEARRAMAAQLAARGQFGGRLSPATQAAMARAEADQARQMAALGGGGALSGASRLRAIREAEQARQAASLEGFMLRRRAEQLRAVREAEALGPLRRAAALVRGAPTVTEEAGVGPAGMAANRVASMAVDVQNRKAAAVKQAGAALSATAAKQRAYNQSVLSGIASIKNYINGFQVFITIMNVWTLVQGVKAIASFAQLGQKALVAGSLFKQFASDLGSPTSLLGDLESASKGTISSLDLMSVVNRSMASDVQLSAEQLKGLADAAFKLSIVSGGTASEAFSTLVRAVSSGSTEGLKALGITTRLKDALEEQAESSGVAAKNMGAAERQAAVYREVLEGVQRSTASLNPQLLEQASGAGRLTAMWSNFTDKMAEMFVTSGAAETFFSRLRESVFGLAEQFIGSREKASVFFDMVVRGLTNFVAAALKVAAALATIAAMIPAMEHLATVLISLNVSSQVAGAIKWITALGVPAGGALSGLAAAGGPWGIAAAVGAGLVTAAVLESSMGGAGEAAGRAVGRYEQGLEHGRLSHGAPYQH